MKENIATSASTYEGKSASRGWLARLLGRDRQVAAVPHGCRVYAIGDIHGRLDLLKNIWKKILADAEGVNLRKVVIFVGDYVDRGLHSKGVIEFLIHAKIEGGEVICLRGNHDQSVLDFLRDSSFYRVWRPFGAPETLLSYGVLPPRFDDAASFEKARDEFARNCPATHVKFLESLPYSFAIGGYYFVHAGARPSVPLDEQDERDLLWIREDFLLSRHRFEKIIVHGHTPQDTAKRHSNRIGIDTGAYATDLLSAVVLEGDGCRFLST